MYQKVLQGTVNHPYFLSAVSEATNSKIRQDQDKETSAKLHLNQINLSHVTMKTFKSA